MTTALETAAEKRKFPRINRLLPVSVTTSRFSTNQAICRNISENGAFLEINGISQNDKASIISENNITVDIALEDNFGNIKTPAVPRWNKDLNGNSSFALGVEFPNLDHSQKNILSSYICERTQPFYKKFIYRTKAYLSDVNVFGTTYFARYFDWQGKIREEFFKLIPGCDQIMALGIILFTKHASMEYTKSVKLFDDVIIEMTSNNVRKFSFEIVMKYYIKDSSNPENLAGIGKETICFGKASNTSGKMKLIPVPEPIMRSILQIKEPEI